MDVSTFGHGGGAAVRPGFHGSARAMFPVVFKGLALTLLTLGVYRFWYVTQVRRFLWENSELDGDAFEYTGRGVELFIGFLIAVAALVPFYTALFLLGLATGPIGAVLLQYGSTVGLFFLAQYALFRARRYRLTRTIWRGVRFQQSGSGWAYAGRSLGWGIVTLLTLGLAYPWMRTSLERYKMTNTWFGDQKGEFSATAGQLFKRGILLWLVAILVLGLAVASLGLLAAASGEAAPAEAAGHPFAAGGAIGLSLIMLVLILPLLQAIEYRWWANGCSIGHATVGCDLGLFAFFKVYLGYAGILLLFGLGIAVLVVAAALIAGSGTESLSPELAGAGQVALMASAAAFYFVVGLIFAALWQLFVVRPIWRKSLESVEIRGLAALMANQSTEPPANAFGEGVADALDFGGF
ncbi:DUF898 family protein [Hansschlegelia zhihuaiae]|uniref:DUF898 family protein n=1 Tax=Hansschlegelia zhihuaiae TaxID=405005 RepID=A0A4Q0MH86_9HYPH|nr:DUF898 family protein [Hansschlegelia zhihuaiae]RXF72927.1 DUF898 family protein [Hansschlegelia zhihuaiae]